MSLCCLVHSRYLVNYYVIILVHNNTGVTKPFSVRHHTCRYIISNMRDAQHAMYEMKIIHQNSPIPSMQTSAGRVSPLSRTTPCTLLSLPMNSLTDDLEANFMCGRLFSSNYKEMKETFLYVVSDVQHFSHYEWPCPLLYRALFRMEPRQYLQW